MALYNQSVQHSLYPLVKLKSLLLSKPQYGANEAGLVREHKEQVRYIRITDIEDNTVAIAVPITPRFKV